LCPRLYATAIWDHTTSALAAGATKQEIFEVCGLSHLLGLHALTLGAPIMSKLTAKTDICGAGYDVHDDKVRIKQEFVDRCGFWPEAFTILLELDQSFFHDETEFSSFSYSELRALQPENRELVMCALKLANIDPDARDTEIHMHSALKLGVTPDEIVEMLEITSLMGIHGVTRSKSMVDQRSHAKTEPDVYHIRSRSVSHKTFESSGASSMIRLKPILKAFMSFGEANRHGSSF
jgi:alkylhydroperoxidase/carboxymuconolactone decarboxylase family protein YurZ